MRRTALIVLVLLCSVLWWATEKEAAREGEVAKEVAAVDQARKFCKLVVPRLEQRFEETGAYPARIGTVLTDQDIVPNLLEAGGRRSWYRAVDGGEGFEFRLEGQSKVSGREFSMVWESGTRRWRKASDS